MRTVQMTFEGELLEEVDKAVKKLHTTRSAFTRRALREALKRLRIAQEEERHRRGYQRHPVKNGEFNSWEGEQKWGDR